MRLPTHDFVSALTALLGADQVITDPTDLLVWGRDWTRMFTPAPCAAALPGDVGEVAAVVRLCRDFGIAIVPSGGRTGLAGGAVAMHGELVLSLSRLRRMQPVDTAGQTVRVQAGVTNQEVQDWCAPHGLFWPIDLASKGSSQIGGNIATNAGGVRVIRYGHARQWVLGLQVVNARGDVLDTGGALEKNNTGLDLRQLFIGTEGTLGIITEATLKLARRPGHLDVVLLGVADLPAALRLFEVVRRAPGQLHAFEFFTAFCLDHVVAHAKLPRPLRTPSPCYVLIELENPADRDLDLWLASLQRDGLIQDGTRALDGQQARALWSYRERITESLAPWQPHKNDIALPVAGLPRFVDDLEGAWCGARVNWPLALFGHVGDGNLHLNALQPEGMSRDVFLNDAAQADRELFALVQRHGGSISAEHGIGLVKKPYLAFSRTPTELATMRAVKRALDPEALLNPGKIFDL